MKSLRAMPIKGHKSHKRLVRRVRHRPFLTNIRTVTGHLAMCAVRQSPYGWPDGLERVIRRVERALRMRVKNDPKANRLATAAGIFKTNEGEMEDVLRAILAPSREFRRWNQRKNGNRAPFNFVSRYDPPNQDPDNDFIDLDALLRNVAHGVAWEELERHRER